MTIQERIAFYLAHGLHVTPISRATKLPKRVGWNDLLDLTASDFKLDDNVGVLLGAPIGATGDYVYDIDIDTNTAAARALVHALLPKTGWVFGHASKPDSHLIYRAAEKITGKKYNGLDGCAIEFRGLAKTGKPTQTVFPGSIHKSTGELIAFRDPVEGIKKVDGARLFEVVRLVAVGLVVLDVWPASGNGRHDARMAWSGFLLKAGVGRDEVERLLTEVMIATGSDERDVAAVVRDTAAKLEGGANAYGGGWITEHLLRGADALTAVSKILGVDAHADDGQQIDVTTTSKTMVDRAWAAVTAANDPPGLFNKDGKLVILPHGPNTVLDTLYARQLALRTTDAGTAEGFVEVGDALFRDLVGRMAPCVKPTKYGFAESAPSTEFASLMASTPYLPVPAVKGFSRVPFFAPDGSLVVTPGLHAATGIFYHPDPGLVLADVPAAPTDADLALALRTIDDLVWQFPFADREASEHRDPAAFRRTDYANALAFPLTVLLRGCINEIVPLFLFDKPESRTGASLLVQCLSYLVLGRWPGECAWDKSDSERRKFLSAMLLTGAPIIFLDDVKDLISTDLHQVLTGTQRLDRRLGESVVQGSPNVSTFAATGNNPRFGRDMGGRVCRVRLDAKVVHPGDRVGFAMTPKTWVPAHRGELLWSFYVLARAWFARGRAPWTADKLAGFEVWSATVGGVLATAGVPGFLENRRAVVDDAVTADDDSIDSAFLAGWLTKFASGLVTITALAALDAVPMTDGVKWDTFRLGNYLRGAKDKRRKLDDGREVYVTRHADGRGGWRLNVAR